MTAFRALKTVHLDQSEKVISGVNAEISTMESPATNVITDFKQKRPAMLESDTLIDQALLMMRKSHVRSVIVIDSDEHFLGLLTLADLESRKVLATAESMGINRAELSARDLMTPKQKLFGMPFKEIIDARIGDLLHTLQNLGTPHVLLTDDASHIRGIVSASEIARQLQVDVNITEKVTNFSQIYGVVSRGSEI